MIRPGPRGPSRKGRLVAALLGLVWLLGCDDVAVTAVEVASVAVSPGQVALFPGETVDLTATPRAASGSALEDRTVSWRSEDPAVATVNAQGRVQGVAPGQTRIVATAEGAEGSATITVNARPLIGLSSAGVVFEGVEREGSLPPIGVQVTNEGGGTLGGLSASVEYAAGEPTGWLQAQLSGTQAPTTLTLVANTAQLGFGVWRAEVRVASELAGNSPQTVQVEIRVEALPARIELEPERVGFAVEEGGSAPPAQEVQIRNGGGGELAGLGVSIRYPAGEPQGWLDVALSGSSAPATITLGADPTGLPTGVYDAFVEVASAGAENSPVEMRARLTVGSPPPEIELTPTSIFIDVAEGAALPPSSVVRVENRGAGTLGGLEAVVLLPAGAPAEWLFASLTGSEAPQDLLLAVTTSELLPGVYDGMVRVSSPDAVNSPVDLPVAFEVLPRPSAENTLIAADSASLVADGVSTSPLTVELRDVRGDPMPFGGFPVTLSASSGTVGAVTDLGNGRYVATYTAPTTAGAAVISGTVSGEAIGGSATIELRPGRAATGPHHGWGVWLAYSNSTLRMLPMNWSMVGVRWATCG